MNEPFIFQNLILTDPAAIKGIYVEKEGGILQNKSRVRLNVNGDITTINFDIEEIGALYRFMDHLLDWMGYSQEQKEEIQRSY